MYRVIYTTTSPTGVVSDHTNWEAPPNPTQDGARAVIDVACSAMQSDRRVRAFLRHSPDRAEVRMVDGRIMDMIVSTVESVGS